ncbi:MAG: CBS domain-containing protein [Spirochaetales bacterium]|nr:CBS domain-containing protein [Spirochaetales bacterium]
MKTVKDILEQKGSEVVSVCAEDTLAQAVLKLTQHKIGAVLVLNEEQAIQGILSERDIIRHLAGRVKIDTTIPVSEVMTREVTYVKPRQKLDACLQLMTSGRFRHLPVVDNDVTVGIISIGDVVKDLLTEKSLKIGELEYFISNAY